jgi:hypothetical protein
VGARDSAPDLSAFIYAVLRLPPPVIDRVRLVVMGMSEESFAEKGYPHVESWERVGTPARRRRAFFNGEDTLAVYIASRSDIDDIIPTLTAYQIERDKLHRVLNEPRVVDLLERYRDRMLDDDVLEKLRGLSELSFEEFDRLRTIWQEQTGRYLLAIAEKRLQLAVRLLSGSLADYRRATRRWWQNIERRLPDLGFEDRPVYFVSSNTHSGKAPPSCGRSTRISRLATCPAAAKISSTTP